MMQTVLVLRGLPASGKSTFARALLAGDPDGWVRVNKDDIRERLLPRWTKQGERTVVIPERDRLVAEGLAAGKNVVVDDTNFEDVHVRRMYEVSKPFKANVEVKQFDVDVDEAVARDSRRQKPVGEDVIRDMARRYLGIKWELEPVVYVPGRRTAIICDLDGTLSLFCPLRGCECGLNHRNPYDASTCDQDVLNTPVANILRRFTTGGGDYVILLVSGREDLYREQTMRFLDKYHIYHDVLFMRKAGDHRKDAVVKHEIFEEHIRPGYNVDFVLDDRDQVVQFWRSLGLTCLQVAPGKF